MEYQHTVFTQQSVPDAVQCVRSSLASRNFAVLAELDLTARLREHGQPLADGRTDVRVLEVCAASDARQALDIDLDAAFFMPCKVVVRALPARSAAASTQPPAAAPAAAPYAGSGGTQIGVLRSTAFGQFLQNARLGEVMKRAEAAMVDAVDEAARAHGTVRAVQPPQAQQRGAAAKGAGPQQPPHASQAAHAPSSVPGAAF